VQQALDWVRLVPFALRRPSQLSGGQLQRVALARALVASPDVLLLDEPLSNLDAALREELRAEIAALRSRLGTTMIYVTHDQGEALALADRIAVMNQGVLEQLDAPEKLYREPRTAFVASFVGGANILEGELVGRELHAGELVLPLPLDDDAPRGRVRVAVRAEDIRLGDGGPRYQVLARLFLGNVFEYRLQRGDLLLRALGGPGAAVVGGGVGVGVERCRVFAGT
jgi:ABC-type Fe3+/spermidine/putrescine transport system ATPase subunit